MRSRSGGGAGDDRPRFRDGFKLVYREDALDAVDRAEQQVDAWLDAMVAEARALACNGEINQGAFAGVGDLYAAHAFFKRVREALERPAAPGLPGPGLAEVEGGRS